MAANKAVGQALGSSCRAFTARLPQLALAGFAALALAGCAGDNKPRICPFAVILAPTSQTVGFRPDRVGDPSGELYRVTMTGVSSDCSIDEETRMVSSDLDINFRATRAPNGAAASFSTPYYLAITVGEQVVTKRNFNLNFSFAPGEGVAHFREHIDETTFRVDNDKQAVSYRVVAGFQLTQEQLDYLQKMGRFAP